MGNQLGRDDGAVSPVLGVILVVAISALLAATTAAFVMGDGSGSTPPESEFRYEYSQIGNGNLTMVYEGADTVAPANIEVRADIPFRPAPGNDTGMLQGDSVKSYALDRGANGTVWNAGSVSASSEFTIVGSSSNLGNGTVRIVWMDPTSDRTTVLGTWTGPNA